MIRECKEEDLIFLKENNMLSFLEVSYHGDVIKKQIFVSTLDNGKINGALYFKYHYTWYGENTDYHRIEPCICTEDDNVRKELICYAKDWLSEQDELCSNKKACLCTWADHMSISELSSYMNIGFIEYQVCPCLKFDFSEPIPDFPVPEGMHIEKLAFEPKAVNAYIEATKAANAGEPDSINELWFMTGEDSFEVFVLKEGEHIVSAASTWKITAKRAAIENIFSCPQYRHKNLAKVIITYVLNRIKEKGYDMATLGMRGTNLKAHRLYHSLGFTLFYNQIELILPRESCGVNRKAEKVDKI